VSAVLAERSDEPQSDRGGRKVTENRRRARRTERIFSAISLAPAHQHRNKELGQIITLMSTVDGEPGMPR